MRRAATIAIALTFVPATARADSTPASASGAVGAGMFGDRASVSVDVGIDVAGVDYAIGLGGRLRWVAGDGVRSEDWDEPSELARIVRYFVHRRDGDVRVSVAAGELGGATMGNGAVIAGYGSGIDVDHGHLGLQARADGERFGGETLVDDVVAPRIAAARGRARVGGGVSLGAAIAGDLSAPSRSGSAVVPIASVDAALERSTDDGRVAARVHADGVVAIGLGAGVHAGAQVGFRPAGASARIRLGGEVRAGSPGYVPGWFGPLYELERQVVRDSSGDRMGTQLDLARDGGLGGAGAAGRLGVEIERLGELSLRYAQRPGLPRVITARLTAPHRRPVQLGAWAAAEVARGQTEAVALAAEARVSLPRRLFARFEVARLYRDLDAGPEPLWSALASLGAVFGE